MARSFHCLSYTTLILQRGAGNTTWKDASLLVQELLEEFGISIVNILDTAFLKATVFLPLYID